MTWARCIVISLLGVLSYFQLSAQQFNQREITLPEAIHTSSIDILYFDPQGLMWLSSGNQLYNYDGISFKAIREDSAQYKGDIISSLYQARSGQFWVGWKSGQISLLKGDSLIAYDPEEGHPSVPVIKWAEDDKGRLWMATYGEGLYLKSDNGRWYNFSVEDGLPSREAYDLIAFKGTLNVATDQGLACCSFSAESGKQLRVLTQDDGLSDQIVKSLCADSSGLWLAYYEPVVDHFDKKGFIKSTTPLPRSDARQVLKSGHTLWWLSEAGHLYYSTAGHPWQQLEVGHTGRAHIRQLASDEEGHLWVATNKGLFIIDQWLGHFPASQPVTAIASDGDLLWYSQKGELRRKNLYTGEDTMIWQSPYLILNLYVDALHRVWAGTFDGGVIVYNNQFKTIQNFTEEDGISNNNVLSIDGNKDAVWLGTLGGATRFSLKGANIEAPVSYGRGTDVNLQYIYAVHVVEDGSVYLATDGDGVLQWSGHGFETMSKSGAVILDLCTDPNGNLWWITPDGKLHAYIKDKEINIPVPTQENGRPAGLISDPQGRILVFYEGGINRWNPKAQNWEVLGQSFGLGRLQPQLHAQSLGSHGFLYCGAEDGIYVLQTNFLPQPFQPKTYLHEVQLFFKPTSQKNFSANENHISFSYTGLWYTDPTAVSYKLKLRGYDLNWTISKNSLITYPRLPPGSYKFSVIAGIDGHFPEEEMKSFSFTIQSPWYIRWYVLLPTIVAMGLLFIYLLRMRVKTIKNRQAREQERVRVQYEALKSQVNPHFLFNSFNTLMALIEDDKEAAAEYLSALSDFFRNILQFREIDLIRLSEEMQVVETYLQLQNKRFGANLDVKIELSSKTLETYIPPLTLQLLLENAFKHNVISKLRPLHIRIFAENEALVVWNNLQEKIQKDVSTGYGLDSIRKKYAFHTQKSVKVEKAEDFFAVYLPLILNQ